MTGTRRDIYREITDTIIAAIEAGAGDFQMPWHGAGMPLERPVNALTQKQYRGANVLALWIDAHANGYGSNLWASFKQWRQLGAHVRKGEHGSMIVFYKKMESDSTEDESVKSYLFARASFVFNANQVEGCKAPAATKASVIEAIETAEGFVRNTGATIRFGGNRACYRYATDQIQMPDRELFVGSSTSTPTEAYYSTLLHELTHWTGHESRLKRDLRNRFGDEAYSMEELVAELGAAFLCADLGVTNVPRPDHAAYIDAWLKIMRRDKNALFSAASRATDAAVCLHSYSIP